MAKVSVDPTTHSVRKLSRKTASTLCGWRVFTRNSQAMRAEAMQKCAFTMGHCSQTLTTPVKPDAALDTLRAQSTQDRYYSRPPDSTWSVAVSKIPQHKRKRMLPEEFIRVF